MDSETIYEALGEVVPIERKNGSKVSIDEGFGAHPDEENISSMPQPLFSQEMTDEAVAGCIFNCCDVNRTGLVKASVLVDFLLKYASENSEIKKTFREVLKVLDPTGINPDVTMEIFQSALNLCISKLTPESQDAEWLIDLNNSLKIQSAQSSISSNIGLDARSLASTELLGMMDIKELQFQFNRLQQENSVLLEQMADVEETNISLRTENSQLKSKINRVELAVLEVGQQSQVLHEDNSQLQGRLLQMKDDLRNMTAHYDECQKELEDKIRELETLQSSRTKGEENCKHLIDTIRHLEDIIVVKEEELQLKDKEIQKIAQDLMEHQLSDRSVVNEYGIRHGKEAGENLASELQSSLGDTPWKKQMASVLKPDCIHPAAWNAMLNEPEYEDQESINNVTAVIGSVSTTRAREHTNVSTLDILVQNQMEHNTSRNPETQAFEPHIDEIVHSTPISKIPPNPICWYGKELTRENSNKGKFLSVLKPFRFLFLVFVTLTVVFAIVSVLALIFMLLLSSTSGCSGVLNYHQQASPYYSFSLWSKVFEIIKPYCTIEYYGCPPI